MFKHQVLKDIEEYIEDKENGTKCFPGYIYDRKYLTAIKSILQNAVTFHLGNGDTYHKGINKHKGEYLFEGNLAIDINPPYDNIWFEYMDTTNYHFTKEEKANPSIDSRELKSNKKGLLLSSRYIKDSKCYVFSIIVFAYLCKVKQWYLSPSLYYATPGRDFDKTDHGLGPIHYDTKSREILLTKDPSYCKRSVASCSMVIDRYLDTYKAKLSQIDNSDRDSISLLNYALQLLNCKNIVFKRNEKPFKLNKKRLKQNKLPVNSYYTLQIQLPKERNEKQNQSKFVDLTRYHTCLGHFKTHTKERPMFGKLVGRYWVLSHVRGNNELGSITKDYSIKNVT